MRKIIRNLIMEVFITLVGTFIIAAGISMFLLPNQLSTGGFSGLGTILYYMFNISVGKTIIILNIPLFVLSIFKLGKRFFIKSIVGTISLSVFIDILEKYPLIIGDKFLACIYGGVIVGIGTAIILKVDASTGGTELFSNLIKSYNPSIKMSRFIMILDIVIVAINVIFLKELEIALYSTISIYLYGKILDIFFEGFYFTKLVFIISDKSDEIYEKIEKVVRRGVTGLYGKGMYTQKDKLVLICAASRRDIDKIRILAKSIDKKSFIVVSNAKEVFGEGFKEG